MENMHSSLSKETSVTSHCANTCFDTQKNALRISCKLLVLKQLFSKLKKDFFYKQTFLSSSFYLSIVRLQLLFCRIYILQGYRRPLYWRINGLKHRIFKYLKYESISCILFLFVFFLFRTWCGTTPVFIYLL